MAATLLPEANVLDRSLLSGEEALSEKKFQQSQHIFGAALCEQYLI